MRVPAAPQTAPISISVRERVGDRWEVTYRFLEPVRGIAFERGQNRFRGSKWIASADGGETNVTWSEVDGREAIVVAASGLMKELKISLVTDTEAKVSDYLVNAAYSDGSRLFYTGHFAARPVRCPTSACDGTQLTLADSLKAADIEWRFETEQGRDIQVLDRRATSSFEWRPMSGEPGQGTYVYFGNLMPRETSFGNVIMDPALPKWMRETADDFMPKLLAWFAKDTSTKLTFKPFIVVTAPAVDEPGRHSKGGTLPGLVQLAVWGEDWKKESPEVREAWLKFLAHELFHLWNGEMFQRRPGRGEAWLTEGSSDYFALRALRALGIIDDAKVGKFVVDAVNHCLVALGPLPLAKAWGWGTPEYTCGAVAWALADSIARSNDQTVGDVFGRVFASAKDRNYGTDDVLAELRKLGKADAPVALIGQIVRTGLTERAEARFAAELGNSGIAVQTIAPSAARLDDFRFASLVGRELARCDCDRRISFNLTERALAFDDVPQCSSLRGIRVVGLGKLVLPKDAALAYDALVARDDTVPIELRVEGKKEPLRLRCRDDYRRLPFKKLLK